MANLFDIPTYHWVENLTYIQPQSSRVTELIAPHPSRTIVSLGMSVDVSVVEPPSFANWLILGMESNSL